MSDHEDKYNTIMPQSTDRVICIEVDKPISEEGYANNFLPRIIEMIKKHGEIRMVIYYKKFQGWEKNAAVLDLKASAEYSSKLKKAALVNPPQKEEFKQSFKQQLIKGEVQTFGEDQLQEAIDWATS